MANATVVRGLPTPPPVERVTLELSHAEAMMLSRILWRVGGDPNHSPRKHADSIINALTEVGIKHDWRSTMESLQGHLMFRDGRVFDD